MSNDTPFPEDFAPFMVKQAQRDAPFMSSDMMAMLRKTSSLGTNQAGNSQTILFHDVEESPRCAFVSSNRKFEIISNATYDGVPGANRQTPFLVPWRVHKGYDGVGARIMAKTNINRPISVRLTVNDLVSSTTAQTGPPCPPVLPQSNNAPTLYDTSGERVWNLTRCVSMDCYVTVDVDTNPECAIGFELYPSIYTGRDSPHDYRRNRNIYMSIQSVTLFDSRYTRG